MAKNRREYVLLTTAKSGRNLIGTEYLNMPYKKQKRFIDKLHKAAKKVGKSSLLIGSEISFCWHQLGIEVVATGTRSFLVIRGTPVMDKEKLSKEYYPEIYCEKLKKFIKR